MNGKFRSLREILLITIVLTTQLVLSPLTAAKAQSGEPNRIMTLAWSPDNGRVAVGTLYGNISVWDVNNSHLLYSIQGHQDIVYSLAWSPDDKWLASGSNDNMIRIWDVSYGKLQTTITGHNAEVNALAWTSDSKNIISGSVLDVQNLRLWDVATGKMVKAISNGSVGAILQSPDSTKIAVVYIKAVEIRDAANLDTLLTNLEEPNGSAQGNDLTAVVWSPDNIHLAMGNRGGSVHIWDMSTGKITTTLRANDATQVDTEISPVSASSFNVDGSKLMSISADGTLRSWDVQSSKVLETSQVNGHVWIGAAAWSTYKGRMAFGSMIGQNIKEPTMDNWHITVPLHSFEDIQALTKRCAKPAVQQTLTAKLDAKQLPAFTSAVKALTSDQLPPACAADLIAVAEALQKAP